MDEERTVEAIMERHKKDNNYIRATFDERVLDAHEDREWLLKLIMKLQGDDAA